MSSIASRQYVFNVGHSPFAHNDLIFYDDDGNIVGQFHGLATDPIDGTAKRLGRSSDYLTVVPDADRCHGASHARHAPHGAGHREPAPSTA